MAEPTPIAEMTDRRNPMSPLKRVSLYSDRLELWAGPKLERRITLDQVTQVRLAVEMAGQLTQVVCRVTGPAGEIVFGSRTASKGAFEDNAAAFQTLLVALHEALRPHFETITFLEGQSLSFRLIMSGLGVVMALVATAITVFFAVFEGSWMLAFAGVPFLVLGSYLAWMFRPARPPAYDPEGLITRFTPTSKPAP